LVGFIFDQIYIKKEEGRRLRKHRVKIQARLAPNEGLCCSGLRTNWHLTWARVEIPNYNYILSLDSDLLV
jgi:hypothetical protein